MKLAVVLRETQSVLLVGHDPQDAGSAAWWLDRDETHAAGFDVAKETSAAILAKLLLLLRREVGVEAFDRLGHDRFDVGRINAESFTDVHAPDLRADVVLEVELST